MPVPEQTAPENTAGRNSVRAWLVVALAGVALALVVAGAVFALRRVPAAAISDGLPQVLLKTNEGDILLELYEDEAPNTVANFISLVERGFYNGTKFHRVLRGFMAQGGDPEGKGSGGPGYTIRCECRRADHRLHERGVISMAHAGTDTGGSQFFITFAKQPHLDGLHTVFGHVIDGMPAVDKLRFGDVVQTAVVIQKRDHPYVPETIQQ